MSGTVQTKRVRVPALKYLLFFSFLSGQVYNGNTLFSAYTDDPESMDIELYGNYPNPFNPATSIRFSVPASGSVNISVYDFTDDQVATILTRAYCPALIPSAGTLGKHPSGVYIVRIGTDR